MISDIAEETIDNKSENEESDVDENITAPGCIEDDNSYDATNDTSTSTVSVPLPALLV